MLYNFNELEAWMNDQGFPPKHPDLDFQVIRTDFREAYNKGEIEFREDGVYLSFEGKVWKGYMFMPNYRISLYESYPRIHLRKCEKITEFIQSGVFRSYYTWSNAEANDILDRDTGETHEGKVLNVCSHCRGMILDEIDDTKDFFNSVSYREDDDQIEVDIFGYTRDKENISRQIRREQEYTCEICSVKALERGHRRWWHTHHVDGNKTNNQRHNLSCLCILCHSKIDNHHKENFLRGTMQIQLDTFLRTYIEELRYVKNPYI